MADIRLLEDGNRFYIVLENATDEDKTKALAFVSNMLNINNNRVMNKIETPQDVIPANTEPLSIPAQAKEVSTDKILSKRQIEMVNSTKDFVEAYKEFPNLDHDEKEALFLKCKRFMWNYIKGIDKSDTVAVKKFLIELQDVLEKPIKEILKRNASRNLQSFLETETEYNIQAAYDICRKNLCQGLGIKL